MMEVRSTLNTDISQAKCCVNFAVDLLVRDLEANRSMAVEEQLAVSGLR